MTRIEVASEGGGYPIHIARGAISSLPGFVERHAPAGRYAVISDATVAGFHGDTALSVLRGAGLEALLLRFPPGEANKSRESWTILTDRMLQEGFGRDSAVIALGGGVTGDLAGFVAATYMRGIPVVQVPTSTVAMVDSSVGGKTGVDVPGGKNLVGAFHPPRAVVVDPDLAATLPRAERARGLAEAVKHGAIRDRSHLEGVAGASTALLDGDADALAQIVAVSVGIKAEVVSEDEREGGVRRILNFGHTLAHALEAVTRFALSHGEAVAVGMVLEARLGEVMGITEAGTADVLATVLQGLELPVRLPRDLDFDRVVAATRSDKKNAAGVVRYALLRKLGEADPAGGAWVHAVPDQQVLEVLRRG